MHKIKTNIKKEDPKKDRSKIVSQMKSAAFTMISYDDLLNEKVDFKSFKANDKAKKMKAKAKKASIYILGMEPLILKNI